MDEDNDTIELSLFEPYGHGLPQSKFERYWESFQGPYSLQRKRIQTYSVYAGMSLFPLSYQMKRFDLDTDTPTTEWISKNLQAFVRTEFLEKGELPDLPNDWPIRINKEIHLPNHFLNKFLIASEWSGRIGIKLPDENSPSEIAKCLYEILCDSKVGSNKNAQNNNQDDFIKKIIPTIEEKRRLLFVILGFPFKDQNRFRVPFEGDTPDIGEISFMIRLFNLTQVMYQVHPYGVDVVVLTDGELYREIFGVSKETVLNYLNHLKSYRKKLNLQGAVSFICLKELINRSSDDSRAWDIVLAIRENIKKLVNSKNKDIIDIFQALVSGMKWNMNTRKYLNEFNDEQCWKILRLKENDVEDEYKDIWHEFNDKAIEAAFEYASINLMLRWTNLIHKFFPDAIRATVHPKLGQFGLAGSSGFFAWNGVATSRSWPKNIDDIKIMPYLSLNEFNVVNQVKLADSGLPLFFTESLFNENIENAKNVLKKEGWQLGDIYGREFKSTDLNDFVNLGLGDKDFSWERKIQSKEHYNGLFQLRISHYIRYDFGVHGIWKEKKLIGQCGLQVLNEDLDEIELVIFLGKDYTNKGIGNRLTKYIFNQCKKAGINEIYGVSRPDNHVAIKLIKKFNGQRKRTIKHFNQKGILYYFNLKGG